MTEVLILLVAEQKRIFKVGFKSDGIYISGKNIEFYKIENIRNSKILIWITQSQGK